VANRTRDRFIIDVTNGISWLRGESTVIISWVFKASIITITIEAAESKSHLSVLKLFVVCPAGLHKYASHAFIACSFFIVITNASKFYCNWFQQIMSEG
jgi:hypothetical protein